jgi:F-type H+-transporting ATPase subunit b
MSLYSRTLRGVPGFPRVFLAAIALLVFSGIFQTSRLQAQEAQPKHQSSPSSSSSSANTGHDVKPASQEAAGKKEDAGKEANDKEAKEAGKEEKKQYPAPIHWISNKTGLSLNVTYWLCVLLNFAIVFVFMGRLMRKNLPGIFKNRTETIQKRIEEARKTSEEARKRLAEVEGRLSRLDVEINQMRREAEENAQAEEKRVLAAAQEERQRIVAATEQEIAMAANAARRDLKAYAAELAIDLAGKKIQVAKDKDATLVREFTAQLGKDGR